MNSDRYRGAPRNDAFGRDGERARRAAYRHDGPPPAESQGDGEPYGSAAMQWREEGDLPLGAAERFGRGSGAYDRASQWTRGPGRPGGGHGEDEARDRGFSQGQVPAPRPGLWLDPIGTADLRPSDGRPGEAGRGLFVGKGPKGYQRSDERIREDVSDALARNGELDASEIEVQVDKGEVSLDGTVPERASKRLAEDLIEDLAGVKHVHNRLRVAGSASAKP